MVGFLAGSLVLLNSLVSKGSFMDGLSVDTGLGEFVRVVQLVSSSVRVVYR